ncbi:transcriptional regulator, TetR family [Nitrosomonas cryotolerans]|uniref:Transcriptional regulator, TetR family n=1 Tax=Nitrosomonas cryotolerans ATCC 49181 TaxID=1131553 RepID=A0A1N6JHB8_9PROT|nr:TetR/AcrR family transcriptional regulator [Nitrosomonas cryotolerans]SFQ11718.1 transcriptional regulator, TetR family [Nitrosomonas cryotolerans]SIO43794.1 transcriptional regulator, TetR family [Nitrosomonas cryotolerans ATCC 49181]
MPDNNHFREAIIDTALMLGSLSSWEAVRLYDIAAELNISLDEIRLHFREKEDLVDAWFDRADSLMLKTAHSTHFLNLSTQQRLHCLIMAWLDALAPHRQVTKQMICGKLEPGHLHIQIPGLMRISRTVQWIREAAQRDATSIRRALEETALTTLYLMTFYYWMRDSSKDSRHTRTFLDDHLSLAKWLDHTIYDHRCHQSDKTHSAISASDETVR